MINDYELLICIQGVEESLVAIEYGLHMAELLKRPVLLLAIAGEQTRADNLQDQVDAAMERLEALGVEYRVEWERGSLAAVVPAVTQRRHYITIYNAHPQDAWEELTHGKRFRRMIQQLTGPVLRVRQFCWPMQRVLICSGGLKYSEPLELMGTELAQASGARLTLLHVVPPVTLDYQLAQKLAHNWDHLLQTDTPQARHFRRALDLAEQMGVQAELKVRHGPVVDQILAEIKKVDYHLIGMGSPYASHNLSRLYRPNVTASVAAEIDCPILSVH